MHEHFRLTQWLLPSVKKSRKIQQRNDWWGDWPRTADCQVGEIVGSKLIAIIECKNLQWTSESAVSVQWSANVPLIHKCRPINFNSMMSKARLTASRLRRSCRHWTVGTVARWTEKDSAWDHFQMGPNNQQLELCYCCWPVYSNCLSYRLSFTLYSSHRNMM